jgi:uncharacterized protein (TIGR02594 family)
MTLTVQLPAWLARAEGELGIKEIPGPGDHPRIVEYHQATSLRALDDEVAWCAAMICWTFFKEHMKHTDSARARSYLRWGVPVDRPPLGCVAVLARAGGNQPGPAVVNAQGHVGFFVGFTAGGDVRLLGGNQSNAVCVTPYPASRVLGFRWPA